MSLEDPGRSPWSVQLEAVEQGGPDYNSRGPPCLEGAGGVQRPLSRAGYSGPFLSGGRQPGPGSFLAHHTWPCGLRQGEGEGSGPSAQSQASGPWGWAGKEGTDLGVGTGTCQVLRCPRAWAGRAGVSLGLLTVRASRGAELVEVAPTLDASAVVPRAAGPLGGVQGLPGVQGRLSGPTIPVLTRSISPLPPDNPPILGGKGGPPAPCRAFSR